MGALVATVDVSVVLERFEDTESVVAAVVVVADVGHPWRCWGGW